jgi:hypothetical protein
MRSDLQLSTARTAKDHTQSAGGDRALQASGLGVRHAAGDCHPVAGDSEAQQAAVIQLAEAEPGIHIHMMKRPMWSFHTRAAFIVMDSVLLAWQQ